MLGVPANGLEEYYREVPDPSVAEAIVGGARQAVKELWGEEASGFRYTSCPNMNGYRANNDMTSEILFFAHRLTGDKEFARIAMKAMEAIPRMLVLAFGLRASVLARKPKAKDRRPLPLFSVVGYAALR